MPHIDCASLVSSRGFTSMPAAPFLTSICSGQVKESSPFGPFIFTVCPSTVAVTPAGTMTGFLPMRDIAVSLSSYGRRWRASEYVAEDLAADVLLPGAHVRHHALWRGQDGNAQPVGDAGEVAHRLVDAATRRGHAADLADRRLAVGILELDLELRETVLVIDARVAADIALVHQHVEHTLAQLGGRRRHLGAAPLLRVADAGEHIAERIVHRLAISLPARLDHAGDHALARQIAQHVPAHPQLAIVGAR